MVLGIFAVPFELHIKGQGPTSLAVGADGGYSDFFSLVYHISRIAKALK